MSNLEEEIKEGNNMFEFLSQEERKNKLFRNTQKILEKEVEKAKGNEVLIGIDPETYLGKEILYLSRRVAELNLKMSHEHIEIMSEIREMKKMMAELINHPNDKKEI